MASLTIKTKGLDLDSPVLVEGFPGVGLVGKIAADHLVEEFDMTHYANVHCDNIPKVAVFTGGSADLSPPVRVYADEERDLLVLQSDVPVAPQAATDLAECFAEWYDDMDVTPLYLSGQPEEKSDDVPALYGVGTGDGVQLLADTDVEAPGDAGLISGPTGVLMNYAVEHDRTSVGLVVESDPQFPDPEAARIIIKKGIEPLTQVEVPVDDLVDRAEEIREAKERLARRMQQAEEESTQAKPLRMYQ